MDAQLVTVHNSIQALSKEIQNLSHQLTLLRETMGRVLGVEIPTAEQRNAALREINRQAGMNDRLQRLVGGGPYPDSSRLERLI